MPDNGNGLELSPAAFDKLMSEAVKELKSRKPDKPLMVPFELPTPKADNLDGLHAMALDEIRRHDNQAIYEIVENAYQSGDMPEVTYRAITQNTSKMDYTTRKEYNRLRDELRFWNPSHLGVYANGENQFQIFVRDGKRVGRISLLHRDGQWYKLMRWEQPFVAAGFERDTDNGIEWLSG